MSKRVEPSPSLTDKVYAVLHEAITSGEYPAGYRLRIRDIAAEVGTSVMPVREAIRRLEEAGFAERVPHKGSVVKGQHLAELLHIYGTRQILEVEAARRGTAQIDEAGVARMREEFELMRRAITEGAVVRYLDHDEALLTVLYEAAGNPVLVSTIRTLWQHCRAYKIVGARASLDTPGDDSLWRYQEDLLKAAQSHDADAAAAISNESLANATDRIKAQLVSR
ncbi:GntR family transcriptional regulator [Streptomyces geranii]|uniref:GntR family transcriptional regulator n=1 Tax=Streptomyces geranii TaxID=2058923 RepID=UPI000D0242B2|nr:GntR family transcriptional regulator [Streptomyces geranii]